MESTIHNLSLPEVLRLGIMLLAFFVAFYALIAKERKSPLLIDSMFYATYGLLFLLGLALVIDVEKKFSGKNILLLILILFVISIAYYILKVHNRVKYLRTDHVFKNLKIIRYIKNWLRRSKSGRTYEHYSSNIEKDLSERILELNYINLKKNDTNVLKLPMTGIYQLSSHDEADKILTELALIFLEKGKWVQYTSCTRHPIEFLTAIKQYLEKEKSIDWEKVSTKIVVVDACTPHFGFTDSIYAVRSDDAKKLCLELITSEPSFSGIHTALAKAFNEIKKKSSGTREPALIIYEGLHSLTDLESEEQYRIFFSHVLPSERLWGGMFTVVVEFSPSPKNLYHIRTYGDYFYNSNPEYFRLSSKDNNNEENS